MAKKVVALSLLAFGFAAVGAARAAAGTDSGGTSTTSSDATDQLQEVVVTAQRRSENLQAVPIAVGVVSAEALQAEGLASTEALSAAVPGLDMTRASDRSTPFLRGVGAPAVSLGVEPSVATYIDGVYVSSPSGHIVLQKRHGWRDSGRHS